ncbi:MAG: TonB-dependent receptor [Marinoscillum sp.]
MKRKLLIRAFARSLGLVMLLSLLGISPLFAQQTVRGTVTSDDDGTGLPGVSVVVKGTTNGAITDMDGNYSINVPTDNQILVYSFVGFKAQEIDVAGRSTVDVSLSEDLQQLEEVVVVGYGTQKKSDITGAVAIYGAENLKERPVQRIDQAMVGQMAGVRVVQSSGVPGKGFSVQVRGTGSISGNNEPLYVIDGFPLEVAYRDGNGNFGQGSPLDNINPNDIKSIQVLKDAAAAAIYGSRASNGVVIITTKSGGAGKPAINFNYYTGWSETAKKLDVLSSEEWIDRATEMINTAYIGRDNGSQNRQASDDNTTRLANEQALNPGATLNSSYYLDERWAMPGHPGLVFIDWQDEMFRKGIVQNYQLSANGGTDAVKYFVSGDYLDQEGIAWGVGYKRFSGRANVEIKASEKLTFGLNLNPTYSIASDPGVEGKDQQMHLAVSLPPVSEEEVGIDVNVGDNVQYFWGSSRSSPVRVAQNSVGDQKMFRTLASSFINYEIINGLSLKSTFNLDNADQTHKEYTPAWVTRNRIASGRFRSYQRQTYVNENTLSYSKSFGGSSLSAVAGQSYSSTTYNNQDIRVAGDFNIEGIQTLNQATVNPSGTFTRESRHVLISYFGRLQYSLNDKYLLTGSIRRDGSSKFGPDTKWGVFPAVSGGWILSEEGFLPSVINFSKLRASWGKTGNTPINGYEHVAVLDVNHYTLGDQQATGLRPGNYANSELKWEEATTVDIGLDIGLFKNRLFTSFDVYKRVTSDLLLQVGVPSATGFSTAFTNIGEVENTGWEWELTTRNFVDEFTWSTSLNLSHNSNQVVHLGPEDADILGGDFDIQHNILRVGEPMYSIYVVQVDGILSQADIDGGAAMLNTQEVGDAKYVDQNDDGVIDGDDRVLSGHPNPDYLYGITNNFSYKGFDLSVFVQGQSGGSIYSTFGRAMDRTGQGYNDNKIGIDRERWTAEDQNFDAPRGKASSSFGRIKSTDWLYSSNYIRVRNITLGYNLDNVLQNLKYIDGGRIYITAENWFGKDSYDGGFNPEAVNNGGDDYGAFPLYKSMVFGLNLKF